MSIIPYNKVIFPYVEGMAHTQLLAENSISENIVKHVTSNPNELIETGFIFRSYAVAFQKGERRAIVRSGANLRVENVFYHHNEMANTLYSLQSSGFSGEDLSIFVCGGSTHGLYSDQSSSIQIGINQLRQTIDALFRDSTRNYFFSNELRIGCQIRICPNEGIQYKGRN